MTIKYKVVQEHESEKVLYEGVTTLDSQNDQKVNLLDILKKDCQYLCDNKIFQVCAISKRYGAALQRVQDEDLQKPFRKQEFKIKYNQSGDRIDLKVFIQYNIQRQQKELEEMKDKFEEAVKTLELISKKMQKNMGGSKKQEDRLVRGQTIFTK